MRTEQDILKDFGKLGWSVSRNNNEELVLHNLDETLIKINKIYKWYKCKITIMFRIIAIQEHKLLNELFTIWGWI